MFNLFIEHLASADSTLAISEPNDLTLQSVCNNSSDRSIKPGKEDKEELSELQQSSPKSAQVCPCITDMLPWIRAALIIVSSYFSNRLKTT